MTEDITEAPATETTPETTSPPETTGEAVKTALDDVRHDGEVAVHHGLAHLEEEFVKYASEAWAVTEVKAKEALAWVAGKI